jgi:carbamoyltransferase
MYILGINAYHGDSSACLLKDGQLLAAAEEERFRRIKHWAGFPSKAIRYCLQAAEVGPDDVDHIAVNRNPKANVLQKSLYTLRNQPSFDLIKDRLRNATKVRDIRKVLSKEIGSGASSPRVKIHHVEHHVAHLASAFFVSPFDEAVVVSVDGFGDFVGAMWGMGRGRKLEVGKRIYFPHSLGLFYLALTQFLGFPKYGDEYKVMGLAAFGEPSESEKMQHIVGLNGGGRFELGLPFFNHCAEGFTMAWDGCEPKIGRVFSRKMEDLLGPARHPDEDIEKYHENLAASLQATYEQAFFHLLNSIYEKTKIKNLCLAGGCAMNSVANGKIFDRTPFEEVYIQAAAGDAGGALGAAYHVWNQVLDRPRDFVMDRAYWGPEFSEDELRRQLADYSRQLEKQRCSVERIENEDELCRATASEIASGKVVGWFQDRMEWGPRALGNRSIVVDPRRAEMKDVLNERIKRRETFRPFAPSILLEKTGEYFEKSYPDPFMIKVYPIRPEKRDEIPAVTHVDGSGRLQTVRKEDNPRYWKLIKEFEKLTGVPVVLNTSFNENEPIVCTPQEAIECFLRTRMDVLVMGEYMIKRQMADGRWQMADDR